MTGFALDPPGTGRPLDDDRRRRAIRRAIRSDEARAVRSLLNEAGLDDDARKRIGRTARRLAAAVRRNRRHEAGMEAFLAEYDLSDPEGVVLMCLAEALLRIPDDDTKEELIAEKIGGARWEAHLGHSESLLVNASTWGLMLTGRVVSLGRRARDPWGFLGRLVARSGEPLIREAVLAAMRIMSRQFVMGRSIGEALERAADTGASCSFDMLGEAAYTAEDADRYFERYADAIAATGRAAKGARNGAEGRLSVSVKLSALHPRFEFAKRGRCLAELAPRLIALAELACEAQIPLTVDSEEARRLDLTLDVLRMAREAPTLEGWDGLGLAVQAYQKRARRVLDWLYWLAGRTQSRIPVRLVKGAYWDSEIKAAQEAGLSGYPVFTRKRATDLSYIACARRLFGYRDRLAPQFATHNAHTIATVIEIARELGAERGSFEFQRLHGMGESLYAFMAERGTRSPEGGHPVRIYAPVGEHRDLLPYLVRRLLENGANTSFVNRLADDEAPLSEVVADPIARVQDLIDRRATIAHPRIPLPADLFGARRNSGGLDLDDPATVEDLFAEMNAAPGHWTAAPVVNGKVAAQGDARPSVNPADTRAVIGETRDATETVIDAALSAARKGARGWAATPADERASCLERVADLYEANRAELMAIAVREGGKCFPDALGEVREAVDFCRYYAAEARRLMGEPVPLPGPTGERNRLELHPRGVFACISPWNFPLAIFTGQVTGALAAGNAVIAKPAEQTPLMAAAAVRLMHKAGVPADALHLLTGGGEVGAAIVGDGRIDGVAFTGSTETANAIHRSLAARGGAIPSLIAETGGVNAMIADSSALSEQVVRDVVISAFRSTGQRCSALRVLFLQRDAAPRVLPMLAGAMEELAVGDPAYLSTDIGPAIDADALSALSAHAADMARRAKRIGATPLPADLPPGHYIAPEAFAIPSLDLLPGEVFGPLLHVIEYDADRLDSVLDAIAAMGYGLTLGIHSRLDGLIDRVRTRVGAGNTYVNRSMIGAVVGVHPFGGEGLSGTGPKAGGPHYVRAFTLERALSVDTTAVGGNATLMASMASRDDED